MACWAWSRRFSVGGWVAIPHSTPHEGTALALSVQSPEALVEVLGVGLGGVDRCGEEPEHAASSRAATTAPATPGARRRERREERAMELPPRDRDGVSRSIAAGPRGPRTGDAAGSERAAPGQQG